MGRGRARSAGAYALAALFALAAAGCGSQSHENAPRPEPPTHVSVAITPDAVLVRPQTIGAEAVRTQQIPQNEHQAQPQVVHSKAPLSVVFVTANLTGTESKLEVSGPREATSGPMVANGNGSFQLDMPPGTYTVSAAGLPGAKPGKLTVGTYRSSSQNSVLLP